MTMMSETASQRDTLATAKTSRRRALGALAGGGLAAGVAAALPISAFALETTSVPPALAVGNTSPFSYQLEKSAPEAYAGGTIQTATIKNIESLVGLSIAILVVNPGAVREIHWHPNAGELNYCLDGTGTIGVLSSTGESATFALAPGTIAFMPIGDAHYIRNSGADPLKLLIGFSHEHVSNQTFSETLPWVPADLLNQTLGVPAGTFPLIAPRGDLAIVDIQADAADPAGSASTAFSTHVDKLVVQNFTGGTVQPVRVAAIPRLEGMTLLKLDIDVAAIREPHWHGNASEFNYCASGTAQVGIVSPAGESWTFTIEPGDVAYIPKNWFHYIAAAGDQPVLILAFFDAIAPSRIDLTAMTTFFPPDVLAASFSIDPAIFASLPHQGTVVIAGPIAKDANPIATPST